MKERGQSLIEVASGLVVLMPVLMLLIDLAVIMYGVQLNNSACHNAVQAAASGPPAEAYYRARAVIDLVNSRNAGTLVSNFAIKGSVEPKIESAPASYLDPFTGKMVNPGGLVVGTATVTTTVEIRPFVIYHIYGGKLPLIFTSSQSFPLRYVMPTTVSQGQ